MAAWAGLPVSERDAMYTLRELFFKVCSADPRFRVVDMTADEVITRFEHYCDPSHFDLTVQNMIVDAIADKSRDLTSESLALGRQAIEAAIEDLVSKR